jgi:hypothetical protein
MVLKVFTPIIENFKESRQAFKWTETTDRIFKLLKKKIVEKPVLALPSFYKNFKIETNASGTIIGVVLSQEKRPIVYFSKKLNEEKHKY